MGRLCRLILIIVLFLLPTGAAAAGGLASPVSARFENYCLDDAIIMLIEPAGLSRITCGPVNGSVTRTFADTSLSQVLTQLAREHQLFVSLKEDVVVIRAAAKPPANVRSSCSLTRLPLTVALAAVSEAYGLQLVVRGPLTGEVSAEITGTLQEVLDALAAKYNFRWSVTRSKVQVTAVQAK